MSADLLSNSSRSFYENALLKNALGIVYLALAMFYLGMVCRAGGESRSSAYNKSNADNDTFENAYNALTVGYGFAGFFYFCSFTIALGAAFHIMPATGGSSKEAKGLANPSSLEAAAADRAV